MRYLIVFCATWFLLGNARADEWSTADTVRQTAVTGLLIADWAQTRWIAKNCGPSEIYVTGQAAQASCVETNSILGKYPSVGETNNYFAFAILGHAAISYLLPAAWREGWQYVWIGVETNQVSRNRSLGIKLEF